MPDLNKIVEDLSKLTVVEAAELSKDPARKSKIANLQEILKEN